MRKTDRQVFVHAPFIDGYAAHYEADRVVLLQMYEEDGKDFTERRTNAIKAYLNHTRRPTAVRRYAW